MLVRSVFSPIDGIWENDICECDDLLTENGEANTDFIANAREDIPFLLAEIDRLTAECDAAIGDLKHDDNCDICKHTANDGEPDCPIECEGCKLNCPCKDCRDENN